MYYILIDVPTRNIIYYSASNRINLYIIKLWLSAIVWYIVETKSNNTFINYI